MSDAERAFPELRCQYVVLEESPLEGSGDEGPQLLLCDLVSLP